jgi:N-acetylmuramoyl-L-alanine amidase
VSATKRTGSTLQRWSSRLFGLVSCALVVAQSACHVVSAQPLAVSKGNNWNGLFGKTIVVDAGHGGKDTGARASDGSTEKSLNLAIAKRLATDLREAGAFVVMTRTEDVDLASDADERRRHRHMGDLQGRLRVVRKQSIDGFVSIHCNADPSPTWYGAQVLYFSRNPKGKELAETVTEAFRTNGMHGVRSVQSNQTLYLLKRIPEPAVLVEVGFITHPTELHRLQTARYQELIAFSVYTGLIRYFEGASHHEVAPENGSAHRVG